MNIQSVREYLLDGLGQSLPGLLIALGILVVGWLVALIVAAIVKRLLHKTTLDNRLAAWVRGGDEGEEVDVEAWGGRIVFWLLMVFVLVAFFQKLGLSQISEPLNLFLGQVFGYLPKLFAAIALVLVAWMVATGLRFVVRRALEMTGLDRRLNRELGAGEEAAGKVQEEGTSDVGRVSLAKTLSDAVYWLVYLLFLPMILSALSLGGLLQPVTSMIDEIMGYLPNILAAGAAVAIGWLVARIVQRVVTNVLAATGIDGLGDRLQASKNLGGRKLSGLLGFVVYVLILVPVLIAGLQALGIEAITAPASEMLNRLLVAIPQIFGAALVLALAFVVGKLVAGLVSGLLAGAGFDAFLDRIGILPTRDETEGAGASPSELVGKVVLVAVMLFAANAALGLLGFAQLATMVTGLTFFLGDVLLGVVIFGLGVYLAGIAAKAIQASGAAQGQVLATAARVAILVLAGAMAVRQMGLAEDIINLAFGLVLGAVAVAVAVAFGIGGRDLARQTLEGWSKTLKPTKSEKS